MIVLALNGVFIDVAGKLSSSIDDIMLISWNTKDGRYKWLLIELIRYHMLLFYMEWVALYIIDTERIIACKGNK